MTLRQIVALYFKTVTLAEIKSLEYNTRLLEKDLASEKNKTENLQQRIKDLSNMGYG